MRTWIGTCDEDRRTLPLRPDRLRGGGRFSRAQHLPLHGLSEAHRLPLSGPSDCGRRLLRDHAGNAKELCEDSRERQQTSPCLLRKLRDADLCLCGRRSAELFTADRNDHATNGFLAATTDLASLGLAVAGDDRDRPRKGKRLTEASRNRRPNDRGTGATERCTRHRWYSGLL